MFRPKEQTQPADVFAFLQGNILFTVTLFREHNATNGAPRFKALITWKRDNEKDPGARVYKFQGSYLNNREEAQEILLYMLEGWKK